MRHTQRLLSILILAFALLPAAAAAQTPPRPIEPPTPIPCPLDCWWPVAPVAQLDLFEATIEVSDGIANAHYRLRLSNPIATPSLRPIRAGDAEARIIVPVPPGSSVVDLVLSGGPETLEGRLLDAGDAQRIYEEIVRRRIDPALLRSLGDALYEVRAFPVPPGEQREVSFTVTTPLVADGGQAVVEIPWSQMSPRPLSGLVTINVDVPWEVRSALAPGFDADVTREGPGRLSVDWESQRGWAPDVNFRLYLTGGEGLVDVRLLSHRERGEDGYFMLLFAPVVEADESVDRDIVLVLDTSGSMAGEKIEQTRAAAAYVLDHLGDGDRFGIVSFARSVRLFAETLRPAGDADAGIAYVEALNARGGTNIAGALERAMALLSGDRPATVIFVTDGLPTVGITSADAILQIAEQAAPERAQLFAFGVGYDVDTILLDALATRFVGASHYVTPGERIDTEIQRLFERISTPVLTDVEITIAGVETFDLAPAEITGIFAGSQTLLTGRYGAPGTATVTVRGNTFTGQQSFEYHVAFPELDRSDPTVAQIWAQRRVADLLTELRIEGPREGLIDQIVEIATRFGIVTPYTAYLAEEPELAFAPRAAADALASEAAAAPSSGKRAVSGAADIEQLRDGTFSLGGRAVKVVGAHSYYLLDGTWVQEGYEQEAPAPEVLIGSAEFAALLDASPHVAASAALGERVIAAAPDGWVTLVWPQADAHDEPTAPPGTLRTASSDGTRAAGSGDTGGTGGGEPTAPPGTLRTASSDSTRAAGSGDTGGTGGGEPAARGRGDTAVIAAAVALATLVAAGTVLNRRRRQRADVQGGRSV